MARNAGCAAPPSLIMLIMPAWLYCVWGAGTTSALRFFGGPALGANVCISHRPPSGNTTEVILSMSPDDSTLDEISASPGRNCSSRVTGRSERGRFPPFPAKLWWSASLTGRPTGGKCYGSDAGGKVIEAEARVVVEALERYARGESTRKIAAALNARGVPSPGSTWESRTHRAFLAIPVYRQ